MGFFLRITASLVDIVVRGSSYSRELESERELEVCFGDYFRFL